MMVINWKLFILLFILLGPGIIIFSRIDKYYQEKIDALTATRCNCEESQLLQDQKSEKTGFKELLVAKQKVESDISSTPGNVFFTAQIKEKYQDTEVIEFRLEGDSRTIVYTADLIITFNPDKTEILDINSGATFPLYPRKNRIGNKIVITGVSSINNNNLIFGRPNSVYASVKIRRKSNPDAKDVLNIDEDNTKVFYQTQNVLDWNNSVKSISI